MKDGGIFLMRIRTGAEDEFSVLLFCYCFMSWRDIAIFNCRMSEEQCSVSHVSFRDT